MVKRAGTGFRVKVDTQKMKRSVPTSREGNQQNTTYNFASNLLSVSFSLRDSKCKRVLLQV